jgi:hypothetical protein
MMAVIGRGLFDPHRRPHNVARLRRALEPERIR